MARLDRSAEIVMDARDLELLRQKFPLSADTLKRNSPAAGAAQAGQGAVTGPEHHSLSKGARPSRRIKQRAKELGSQLERIYLEYLKGQWPGARIYHQAVRLRLVNGVYYTPDIMAFIPWPFEIRQVFWEVKGPHAWEDAIVKLKVAPTSYPDCSFVLVWREAGGMWREQEILP